MPGHPGAFEAEVITDVRTGRVPGYDRVTFQFRTAVPGYRIAYRPGSTVALDPSGLPAQLDGSSILLVVLTPATTRSGYAGPTDLKTGSGPLRELRQVGDFEAVTRWALGLDGERCYRSFVLEAPPRLVIDIASS